MIRQLIGPAVQFFVRKLLIFKYYRYRVRCSLDLRFKELMNTQVFRTGQFWYRSSSPRVVVALLRSIAGSPRRVAREQWPRPPARF